MDIGKLPAVDILFISIVFILFKAKFLLQLVHDATILETELANPVDGYTLCLYDQNSFILKSYFFKSILEKK